MGNPHTSRIGKDPKRTNRPRISTPILPKGNLTHTPEASPARHELAARWWNATDLPKTTSLCGSGAGIDADAGGRLKVRLSRKSHDIGYDASRGSSSQTCGLPSLVTPNRPMLHAEINGSWEVVFVDLGGIEHAPRTQHVPGVVPPWASSTESTRELKCSSCASHLNGPILRAVPYVFCETERADLARNLNSTNGS